LISSSLKEIPKEEEEKEFIIQNPLFSSEFRNTAMKKFS